mmetsp:Transcript_15338/g.24993  ORF Transcript_15338/g.24993 Transcript_15338/m.24993 type:complete len:594 (+) Transcript_15338:8-1789(+)
MEYVSEAVGDVVLNEFGFKSLTPVQQATIPQFLGHCDVAVEACTGSGKTLAFVMPVFEMLIRAAKEEDHVDEDDEKKKKRKKNPPGHWGAVIISPTRELAQQIFNVAQPFCKALDMHSIILTGGGNVGEDLETVQTQTIDLVIGTPGRLNDVMERAQSMLKFKNFQVLVLDEADVLLDMGFEKTVTSILRRLPKQRRTGLFSATQTKEVKALIRAGLRNPAVISVQVQMDSSKRQRQTPTTLDNLYLVCEPTDKLRILCELIHDKKDQKLLVFFSTCASVDFFSKALNLLIPETVSVVTSLHGKMPQKKRMRTYDTFAKKQGGGVLLVTDVAARGIDIPDVDLIVQFDPPQDPSFFVHRVGRTARAGRDGRALVFLLPAELAYVNLLESRKVPMQKYPGFEELAERKRYANCLEKIRKEVFKDRDLLEKGTKAFIAFLRSYKEHKCPFIFKLSDLKMSAIAESFVLLRLPKVKELRETKGIKGFEAVDTQTVAKIPFKDKQREKQRQANYLVLQKKQKEEEEAAKASKKRKAPKADDKKPEKKAQPKRRNKGIQQAIYEEWDTLATEERLYKNFKKGKISKEEYERLSNEIDF